MDTPDDIAHGEYKVPGGKLVVVDLRVEGGRMSGVQVSGDFFLEPATALDDITTALDGLPTDTDAASLAGVVRKAMGGAEPYGITPEGVAEAVRRALEAVGNGQGGAA